MLARLSLIFVAVTCITSATNAAVDAAELGAIAGAVTLEGKPLASGKIAFHGADGQFVGCKIKDGKFKISYVGAGNMLVTIEGKGVPAKYGSEDSTFLMVEVREGDNTFEFSLTE